MFKKMLSFLILSFCTIFQNFALDKENPKELIEEALSTTLEDVKSLLPTVVNDCVSVISGSFIDSENDFSVLGPEPLTLNRCYSSEHCPTLQEDVVLDPFKRNLSHFNCGYNWFFNRPGSLTLLEASNGVSYNVLAFLKHSLGGTICYFSKSLAEHKVKGLNFPLELVNRKGLTNCFSKEISGRTNLNNTFIFFEKSKNNCIALSGRGNQTFFAWNPKISTNAILPQYEKRTSGNFYLFQKNGIISTNASQTAHLSWITFNPSYINEIPELRVETSDCKQALYKFFVKNPDVKISINGNKSSKNKRKAEKIRKEREDASKRFFISEVIYSHKPKVNYEYKGSELVKKCYPDDRYIEVEYDEEDQVSLLKAPVGLGLDNTPIITHRFHYHLNKDSKSYGRGYTSVYDAYNRKSKYYFNKFHRLTSFHRYIGKHNHTLYSAEEYVWDDLVAQESPHDLQNEIEFEVNSVWIGKGLTPPKKPESKPPKTDPEKPVEDIIKKIPVGKGLTPPKTAEEKKNPDSVPQNVPEAISPNSQKGYVRSILEKLNFNQISEIPCLGNLIGKFTRDATGFIFSARFFDYDSRGNILVDTTYGNLTGTNNQPIKLDSKQRPFPNSAEHYSTRFVYSNDIYNLPLAEVEDSGKGLIFSYIPNSDLITSKLLLQNTDICFREFYEYDENGTLIKKIKDDGSTSDKNDLLGVTQRHITCIYPTKTMPIGLPERMDEMYYDPATGQERLLKRIINHYTPQGYLVKKDYYDSLGNYCYNETWEYDAHGNKILEKNALGHVVHKEYDANDNLIKVKGPFPGFEKNYSYDYSNRLISTTETYNNSINKTSYEYDYIGNQRAKIDRFGNRTEYVYDDLNRVIQTILPPIQDENGKASTPTTLTNYDILNRPISETDQNGGTTITTYNAYRNPVTILYPNQSLERFEYNLNGTLAKFIAHNGTTTCYIRDCFGRVLIEEVYSPDYHQTKRYTNTYKGEKLITSSDPEGNVTKHTYDGAGRLILTTCGEKQNSIEYDTLGRISKKKEWFGPQEADVAVFAFEYDFLDRLIQERCEDGSGNILSKADYEYDEIGNRTRIKEYSIKGVSVTSKEYSCDCKPTRIVDPLGNTTIITYDYNFWNSIGKNVLRVLTTDPEGNNLIEIYDAFERPVRKMKYNAFGILLSRQDLFYDAVGNCTKVLDLKVVRGKIQKEVSTRYVYNSMNQETDLYEAYNSPEQKHTHTTYRNGNKEKVIKPDGTILAYNYDGYNRLIELSASDNSVHYLYEYDKNDQILKVSDLIQNNSTTRLYNPSGFLISETLGNGLKMDYENDRMGRKTKIELPDGSAIGYTYGPFSLMEVFRLKDRVKSYSHQYVRRDPNKKVLEAQLIGSSGRIRYDYDRCNRITLIETPQWTETMSLTSYDRLNHLKNYKVQNPFHQIDYSFEYSDLNALIKEKGYRQHRYETDSLYNRILKDEEAISHNGLNQIQSKDISLYVFDKNGNLELRQNTRKQTFAYDALNRLIAMSENGVKTEYQYDAFNRRLAKKQGEKYLRYIYEGQNEIGAVNVLGKIEELRVLGEGIAAEIGAAVAIEIGDKLLTPVHDHQGNVVSLLEGTKTVESYGYTAFGEERIFDENGKEISQSRVGNPWRFSSKRFDEESGLIYFGRRYYDAERGIWTTPDPIGFEDGQNLYSYLHHNPLLSVDPDGRFVFVIPVLAGVFGVGGVVLSGPAIGAICGSIAGVLLGVAVYNIDKAYDEAHDEDLEMRNEAVDEEQVKKEKKRGKDNAIKGGPPRDPKTGNYLPDLAADGSPHTTLGIREGESGRYKQGATFDDKGDFKKRIDHTDHNRYDHPKPHYHDATSPNSAKSPPKKIPEEGIY